MENAAFTDSMTAASCPACSVLFNFGSSTNTTSEVSSWARWVIPTTPSVPCKAIHSCVLVKRNDSMLAMAFVEWELNHSGPGGSIMNDHCHRRAWDAGIRGEVCQPDVAFQRRRIRAARDLAHRAILEQHGIAVPMHARLIHREPRQSAPGP